MVTTKPIGLFGMKWELNRATPYGRTFMSKSKLKSAQYSINEGNCLRIQPSWTKGGIGRTLNITNEKQRQWLSKAMQQIPAGLSLIPKDKTYKQHLGHYQKQIKLMGLSKCHGLRHAYAQRRYRELTQQFDTQRRGLACQREVFLQGSLKGSSDIGIAGQEK